MLASLDRLTGPRVVDVSTDTKLGDVERAMLDFSVASVDHDAAVSRAIRHHLQSGGKRVRARLALSCAEALAVEPGDAIAIACCCELLHNASLLHDDLQDRDEERRGRAAVWSAFGDDVALLAGDLLLSSAYRALADVRSAWNLGALMHLVHSRVATVIHGQELDSLPHENGGFDLAAYERIAAGKSGPLLSLPLELPLRLSGLGRHAATAREAAEAFAIGYQIADDLQDIALDDPLQSPNSGSNLVWILRAQDSGGAAENLAARHAKAALMRAVKAARALPNGAGDLLCSYAERFEHQLRSWS